MRKNKQQTRLVIGLSLLLGLALIGVFMINVRPADAERGSSPFTTAAGDQATAEADTPTALATSQPAPLSSIIKMISALIVVLFCVYFGLFLLKRLTNRRKGKSGAGSSLEVLDTAYVGPKKSISLVRVAGRSVLVGVTEQQISMLTELSAEETDSVLAEQPNTEIGDNFSKILSSAAGRLKDIRPLRRQPAVEA